MKWGIQVPFEDGFLWVVTNDSNFDLQPVLFDSQEEAQHYMLTVWSSACKVAEYKEDDDVKTFKND